MKTIMTFTACALVAATVFAQAADNVQANASNPAVQELLAKPDGVSILRSESDGSLQIFARGSASYEFGDTRDIRNKTKVAELRAKAALAKYFKEVVQVEESATTDESSLSATLLTKTQDGEIMKKAVSRETVESTKEVLVVRSAAILSGVVILKSVKIPAEGSKTSGEIQVTVGISTKTLAAAAEAHNMITDSLNARREVGTPAPKTNGNNGSTTGAKGNVDGKNTNKPEVRTNDTLF